MFASKLSNKLNEFLKIKKIHINDRGNRIVLHKKSKLKNQSFKHVGVDDFTHF